MSKMHITDTIQELLMTENGERKIKSFLKNNPSLIYWTFCVSGGHKNYIFSEFAVGNQYKSDLVVLHSYSGAFEAHFIELEPIGDKLFNKNRTPSKALRKATLQIDDWRDYIKRNGDSLRKDLVRWAKTKDLLNPQNPNFDPSNYAKEILADPSTSIYYSFHIIIGKRENLIKEKRELKNRYKEFHNIDVGSYDRFLDTATQKYRKR